MPSQALPEGGASSSAGSKLYINLRKQVKYLLIGGAGVWYWQTYSHWSDCWNGGGWPGTLALLAAVQLTATVLIFSYLMLVSASGNAPDYQRWQTDALLKNIIPLLTLCLVGGYLSLALSISPAVAPAPPSDALSSRLLDAANSLGANLSTARAGAQLLLSDLTRTLGLKSSSIPAPSTSSSIASKLSTFRFRGSAFSSSDSGTDLDVSSLLKALRVPDGEALAARLGVDPTLSKTLLSNLDRAQRRAQRWKVENIRTIGWVGAFAGSASVYFLALGAVGFVGAFAGPAKRLGRRGKDRQA
ncbi:hypothetical protein IE81DRAFT_323922 [Ceraceosorus guamensis]|uniref:Uncharacterized protein n=1 Tax=Ceraceosorus guamensis TaxID=1522189 RepID=A0A316VXP8_9BASI|nr:hypothetical protein IE81DRAFT_323922 [Ceraceosorus guamensis]PWN42094.1 hypothetical protein IE81DRAFT_323922 [Ceraceosorus guamensis]